MGSRPSLNIGRTQSINTRAQNEDLVCPITSEIFFKTLFCASGMVRHTSAARWRGGLQKGTKPVH